MHQYKTIAQTLFLLSILNLVFAAPLVPREVHSTLNDVVAEDGSGGSEKRRDSNLQPGTSGAIPPEYPSSSPQDGFEHTPQSSAIEKATLIDPTMEASTSAQPLSESAANEIVPVPDSNTGASTSSHPPPLAIDRPASVPVSTTGGSTATRYAQVTHGMMANEPKFYQRPAFKKIAGATIITSAIAAFIVYTLWQSHKQGPAGPVAAPEDGK